MIYRVRDILGKLESCIYNRIPFSHIRFGDGGIKFLHCVLYRDVEQLGIILRKEGIPNDKISEVFKLWGYYARRADFIDTPEVYFNNTFWKRLKRFNKKISDKTAKRLLMWEKLYNSAEFDNENYCNPESNYLMITRIEGQKNLFDIIKNKRICLITTFPEVKNNLYGYNIDTIKIVGFYQNHYRNSFKTVANIIKQTAKNYDLWLVAAGEIGRLYSGLIKECGGRTVDIGYVVEFWLGQNIHPRLQPFLCRSCNNPNELILTNEGKKYQEFI